MESSFPISGGTDRVLISDTSSAYIAGQLTANSSLDADVTYKLQQSQDGLNFFDVDGDVSGTLLAGGNSKEFESSNYTLKYLYLYVDVGSATTGSINILISSKKKQYSEDVDATIIGEVDVNVVNDDNIDTRDKFLFDLMSDLYYEQRITNQILMEVFDVIITKKDLK